jgi:hypothetical protein
MSTRTDDPRADGQTLIALLLTVWGGGGLAHAFVSMLQVWQERPQFLADKLFLIGGPGLLNPLALLVLGMALFRHASWARSASIVVLYIATASLVLSFCAHLISLYGPHHVQHPVAVSPIVKIIQLAEYFVSGLIGAIPYAGVIFFLRRQGDDKAGVSLVVE